MAGVPNSDQPEKLKRLARDMRLRATRIELGLQADDELDEAMSLARSIGAETAGEHRGSYVRLETQGRTTLDADKFA